MLPRNGSLDPPPPKRAHHFPLQWVVHELRQRPTLSGT
jgi:hypothetical protein